MKKLLLKTISALLALAMLCSFPLAASADEPVYSISVSGFEFPFDVNVDYYHCYPTDFDTCSITGYTGFKSVVVTVLQYSDYSPYTLTTPYVFGEYLKLGNGRAKVTLTATLQDDSKRSYLLAITDPDGIPYSYGWVRTSGGTVNVRAAASMDGAILKTLKNNTRVYYLGTEGDWCKVQLRSEETVGYIHKDYLEVSWDLVEMPDRYKTAVEALQAAHPNWTFRFADVEMTYAAALEKYGADKETYIDPLNYLTEDKIFAMLDIDTYDPTLWTDEAIASIWTNEYAVQNAVAKNPALAEKIVSKENAIQYFKLASQSLYMNPVYIACRAALESSYGTSQFATGTVPNYEGYYNFFGIKCYDSDPSKGAEFAKSRNWNTIFYSIVEGANWVKDQYLDQGAITPYFFRYAGLQNKVYMTDALAPLKEAGILKRAYTDPNAKAEFIIPVYGSMPGEPVPEIDVSVYTDLNPNSWYYTDVTNAIKAGLFKGQTATYFNVTGNITRAEFVTALGRLCGVDVSTYQAPEHLTDVKAGQWFCEEIGWAYATGVTEGRSATTFAPNDPITRQEMSKMLASALEKVLGIQLTTEGAMTFADQASIASWATEWVAKCSANKLFQGDEKGNFNPKNNATRAEAAIVFYRCHQNLKAEEEQQEPVPPETEPPVTETPAPETPAPETPVADPSETEPPATNPPEVTLPDVIL